MFQQADVVIKAVMIGLAIASVVTWTVWLAKTIELTVAKGKLKRELARMITAQTLASAQLKLGQERGVVRALVEAAQDELRLSTGITDKNGKKERVASSLARLEAAAGRAMQRGTGVLATIGSTAPFVGLFGTVWGIMNSFVGISKAQTTNLAVVAPGIAEALLATAIGLVAAIPAVIFYNKYSADSQAISHRLEAFADEFAAIVSRQIDVRT
jgi:biopolymer transport protein ExbB